MNFDFSVLCSDAGSGILGLFDFTIAPELLYYSYIPIIILSLLIAIFVLVKDNYSFLSKLLFLLVCIFSVYLITEIILWTAIPGGIIMFFWALLLVLRPIVILTLMYFTYIFIYKRDVPFTIKTFVALLFVPILLLLPTEASVQSFDINYCEGVSGVLWNYLYALESFAFVTCIFWGGKSFLTHRASKTPISLQSFYLVLGVTFLLLFFSTSDFVGEITGIYEITLLSSLGMLGFIVVLSYLIVKFHAFNIKLAAAQALVVALIFITGSELFFVESLTNYILVSITLIFSIIGGYFLVRSVKREIAQREEIAQLADTLAKANERLKVLDKMKSEFVSIASHQLRSPLTSIRGYASMLAEGSYGKLPEKAQEIASSIAESSKFMAMSIEDYLNVSRIEAGNMKYEMSDFSLKDIAEKVVDEMRPTAMKKGLVMVFRSDCTSMGTIHADVGKTRQIIMNLVDNSMKYTPKGTVTVIAHDDVKKKKMYVTIQDTGIGMSKETLEEVFDKFVRAKNANSVNVTGTGLGLFVAKKMVTEMKGRVWAESEGEGMGSTFNVEFPLVGGK